MHNLYLLTRYKLGPHEWLLQTLRALTQKAGLRTDPDERGQRDTGAKARCDSGEKEGFPNREKPFLQRTSWTDWRNVTMDVFTRPHVAFMLNFLHVTTASWLHKKMFLLLEAKGKILQLNSKMG